MSEEEIKKILLCENIGELAYCGLLDKLDESNNNDLNELKKQAIQCLLDLYQQEKEKNKKYIIHLTDEQYRKVIDDAQKDIDNIWKDKIKEKIEELEVKSEYWNCDEIQVLKELLED